MAKSTQDEEQVNVQEEAPANVSGAPVQVDERPTVDPALLARKEIDPFNLLGDPRPAGGFADEHSGVGGSYYIGENGKRFPANQ